MFSESHVILSAYIQDAGGHCFGVLRFRDAKTKTIKVRVLEGTNSTLFVQDAASRPKYRVQV